MDYTQRRVKSMRFFLLFLPLFLFAKELIIYNNAAYIHESFQKSVTAIPLPNSTLPDTITLFHPSGVSYYFSPAQKISLSLFEQYFLNKKIHLRNGKSAVLRSINSKNALVEFSDKSLQLIDIKEIIFPNYPKNFTQKAHIVLKKPTASVEIGYFFRGVHYTPHYKIFLYNKTALLDGYFKVTNNTNSNITADTIEFFGGDVNFYNTPSYLYAKRTIKSAPKADSFMTQESKDSFLLYKLQKRVTLYFHKTNYINFLSTNLHYKKKFVQHLSSPRYITNSSKHNPFIQIAFQTPKTLLRGTADVFEDGVFLGSSSMAHTSKKSKVTLQIAKDIHTTVTEVPKEIFHKKNFFKATIEYQIFNGSNRKKELILEVPVSKNVKIITSQKYKFVDASTLEYRILLQPHATYKFTTTYKGD